ncbi:DUF2975 domain-containing protein [Klenkia terrae]|uniref:DUF2975 domain-containing protein n=1 Tax=Klenkia terrae TaxID=1052259 RepID=A0ABU8E7M1_9ACTN|nr:DUF2975 domain-containing protein [Klenkia terrae]SSC22985.1 Protein of unknown function DUF2975 [Klenkia terrae]
MSRRVGVVPLLRIALVLLFVLLVFLQTFAFPGQFAALAREDADLAWARWPLTAVAVGTLLGFEVVVVATWKLLGMVERDRIFTTDALPWVDLIVRATAAGGAVFAVGFVLVGFAAEDPGLPLLLFLVLVGIVVVELVVLVLRSLLRQATALRSDLDGVI